MRFFLGGATLDDAIAQLVLEVAGGNGVTSQPEWNPLRLTCGERLRARVQVGAQRGVHCG